MRCKVEVPEILGICVVLPYLRLSLFLNLLTPFFIMILSNLILGGSEDYRLRAVPEIETSA